MVVVVVVEVLTSCSSLAVGDIRPVDHASVCNVDSIKRRAEDTKSGYLH